MISPKTKLAIGSAVAGIASTLGALPTKAAELDATTSAAIGAFGTDAASSLTTWITTHAGEFVVGIIAVSLMFLGFRLVRRIFGGR